MAITKARRERMAKALNLRQRGLSYQEIGRTLRVSHSTAYDDVQDALREITREPAEAVLTIELSRLDAILTPMINKAMEGDAFATDRVLRIMERRARYLGLDKGDYSEQVAGVSSLLEQLIGGADNGVEPEATEVDPGGDG